MHERNTQTSTPYAYEFSMKVVFVVAYVESYTNWLAKANKRLLFERVLRPGRFAFHPDIQQPPRTRDVSGRFYMFSRFPQCINPDNFEIDTTFSIRLQISVSTIGISGRLIINSHLTVDWLLDHW